LLSLDSTANYYKTKRTSIMSQSVRHIAGIAEIVEDMEATVNFYRNVLGLAVEHETGAAYATIQMPGILHFAIWQRSAAAEATYGDASAVDRVPLGSTVGFEVDSVDAGCESMKTKGWPIVQESKKEPWGQITSRFQSPGGALCEISETPWARRITQNVQASASDES
jgi:catechol 2,3-dioxygenase-like lactoylglutathione lyase family enzyme